MTLGFLTYGVAGLALVLLPAAGPLYRIGLLSLGSAFTLLRWGVYVGLVAMAAAQAMGWLIVTADTSTGRIEATDTTRWFGFKDNVVVRLTPWSSGTRVDVRSVSRVGVGDTGTNARRIQRFLDRLRG